MKEVEILRTIKYGVSPGFIISKYGMNYSYEEICNTLPEIKALGFQCFQGEIVESKQVDEWYEHGGSEVKKAMIQNDLEMSMFVCHFLGDFFNSSELLKSFESESYIKKVVKITNDIAKNNIISVPLSVLNEKIKSEMPMEEIYHYTVENFRRLGKIITEAGHKFAVEIPINSIVPNFESMVTFLDDVGYELGLNLDTGHPDADGLDVTKMPEIFKGRIYGTHICDNTIKGQTTKHAPGKGSIDWVRFFYGMEKNGYTGNYDLEIGVMPTKESVGTVTQRAIEEYSFAKGYEQGIMNSMRFVLDENPS